MKLFQFLKIILVKIFSVNFYVKFHIPPIKASPIPGTKIFSKLESTLPKIASIYMFLCFLAELFFRRKFKRLFPIYCKKFNPSFGPTLPTEVLENIFRDFSIFIFSIYSYILLTPLFGPTLPLGIMI